MLLDRVALPIVLAPLAGGPSTPELTAAVCDAGALGLLATGYLSADQAADAIEKTRALTDQPFGVNLFVPGVGPADPGTYAAYVQELRVWAEARALPLGTPQYTDDDWDAKLELVLAERVPLVTFVFGCPDATTIAELKRAGIETWMTVTSPEEARAAEAAGADGLVVQGAEAGGHRASYVDRPDLPVYSLLPLLQMVRRTVQLPLVATGGIATGDAVAAVLTAGAVAAQIGTAFMLCPEAGTVQAHRDAIASNQTTELTRAFTGRLARGIRNGFMAEHAEAPVAYPEIHYLTAPLRKHAREHAEADAINLWAGEAHALAAPEPAAEIVARIASETATARTPPRRSGNSGSQRDVAAPDPRRHARFHALAEQWYEDWNTHDLDRILSHYTDDVEFTSPYVVVLGADPSGTLTGKQTLREYWSRALDRYPEMHFEPLAETHGVNSIVLHYRGVAGKLACELLELGDAELVVRSVAHYGPPPDDT